MRVHEFVNMASGRNVLGKPILGMQVGEKSMVISVDGSIDSSREVSGCSSLRNICGIPLPRCSCVFTAADPETCRM